MVSVDGVGAPGRSGCPENEVTFVYDDSEFDDFDAQSEQLASYDQTYIKTSTGRFRGRRTSAYLVGGASIHFETVNCGMYQAVGCPGDSIGLAVSLGPRGTAVNGIELNGNDVVITRPRAALELNIPAEGGTFLILSVERLILEPLVITAAGREHFHPERRETSVIRNAWVARTLEVGGKALLQACSRAPDARLPQGTATTFVAGLAAALDFQTSLDIAPERKDRKQSFATFAVAREALAGMTEFNHTALAAATGRSTRSIQMAFAQHAQTTPFRYFRALRLNRARSELLTEPRGRTATIGEIAAAHGFGSWSRFTRLYRHQFGEMPSQTRARARDRARPGRAA